MKSGHFIFSFLLLVGIAVGISSCLKDTCAQKRTYTRWDPVYKKAEECRKPMVMEAPHALSKTGKMYYYNNLLLINEPQKGIHFIDNSNPSSPVQVGFLAIEGNLDMVVRNNMLYADQYIDLLTIDISNFAQPTLVCRNQNVFQLFGLITNEGYIVDYAPTKVTEEIDCSDSYFGAPYYIKNGSFFVEDALIDVAADGNGSSTPLQGIAGSYSRLGFAHDHLYAVDQTKLIAFSLANANCPSITNSTILGMNIETIYPYKDKLMVGSNTGLFVFDNTNPANPVFMTQFSHATGCDPVVCDDEVAYVTIKSGTTCNGTFNQLDVLDIKQLPQVSLLKSYNMTEPQGLTYKGEYLYVCDAGLKIYNRTNPLDLQLVKHISDIDGFDAIALPGAEVLMLVGKDGFFQYNITDPTQPVKISEIRTVK